MGTDTNNLISEKRAKLMRYCWLWSVVMLCLLLWGIKAIHRAMQPKYQGKTAEEWFAVAPGWPDSFENAQLLAMPSGVALKGLGTNAIWFLWSEHLRKDSAISKNFYRVYDKFTGPSNKNWSHEDVRQCKSFDYLCILGPDSKVLIPVLLPRLTGNDLEPANETAYLVGCIKEEPDLVVPALLRSMNMTNRNEQVRSLNLLALERYGPKAKQAVPDLRARLSNPAFSQKERIQLATTILRINGSGPEAEFLVEQLQQGIAGSRYDYIQQLGAHGTNALLATPALLQLAKTTKNAGEAKLIMSIIPQIDPTGVYAKP